MLRKMTPTSPQYCAYSISNIAIVFIINCFVIRRSITSLQSDNCLTRAGSLMSLQCDVFVCVCFFCDWGANDEHTVQCSQPPAASEQCSRTRVWRRHERAVVCHVVSLVIIVRRCCFFAFLTKKGMSALDLVLSALLNMTTHGSVPYVRISGQDAISTTTMQYFIRNECWIKS